MRNALLCRNLFLLAGAVCLLAALSDGAIARVPFTTPCAVVGFSFLALCGLAFAYPKERLRRARSASFGRTDKG